MFTRSANSRRRYQMAAVCGIVFALSGAAAQAQVFSLPKGISNATSNSSYPAMVADAAGNIDLAWVDSVSGINFSRSASPYTSFSPAVTIPSSAGAAFQPQIVVDPTGTIVEIAWAKPSTVAGAAPNSFDVFVSRWTSAVPLVFTNVQVSSPTAPPVLVDGPRLAFVGAGVDVVWGNQGTWISTSPNGLTFSAPIMLSTAAQDSGGPRIAVDKSENIFVAWTDRLAEDLGTAGNYCTNPTPITDNNGNTIGYSNTSGGNYYLNWTNASTMPSATNTRSLSSTDWKNVNLDPAYPNGYFGCSYDNLQLFFDPNGNLHLLWGDEAPLEDLLTSVATTPPAPNGSPTFTFPKGTSGSEGVGSPWAATDSSGRTYVVYASGPKAPVTTEGIYFNRSDDGRSFYFPESTVISAPGAISPAYPQVAVDAAGNVNVVWEQADQPITAGGSNTFHLFFTRSQDRGVTFPTITPVFPVTGNSSVLCMPATPSGGTPPTTPDTTTCGTVQMGVDANSDPDLAWVNNPGSAGSTANVDFAVGNMTGQPPKDFGISVNPGTPTAYAGQTVTFNVSAQVANGTFNSPITLGCNDFPQVATAQGGTVERSDYVCTPSGPLTAGGSATVTLTIPPGLPSSIGTNQSPYPFAISGTSGGTTHRVMVAFNSAGPAGSVTPNSANLAVGASQTFNVTLNPGPFTGNVSLQCVGQPAWIQCAFNPQSVAASSSPVTSALTIKVMSAPSGSVLSYPSSIRGTPIQNWHLLLSSALAALYLIALTMMWTWQRERASKPLALRRCAVMTLVLVLSIGLVSCGGAASPSSSSAVANPSSNVSGGGTGGSGSSGGTGGSGGSSGGGSTTPVTATFNVQAQFGNTTAVLGTVSITTP